MLTRAEQVAGIARIRSWPDDERRFVVRLENGERDTVILLAGLLDAEPVDEEHTVRRGSHKVRA